MTFCNVWATQRSNRRCPMRFWGRHAPVGPLRRDPRDPRPRDTQRAADSNTNTDGITLEAGNWGWENRERDGWVWAVGWLRSTWLRLIVKNNGSSFFSWSVVYFRLPESASCPRVDDSYAFFAWFQFDYFFPPQFFSLRFLSTIFAQLNFSLKNFWRFFSNNFRWTTFSLPNVSRFHLFLPMPKIKPNSSPLWPNEYLSKSFFFLHSPNGLCIFILPGGVWYFIFFCQKRCQIFPVCPTALPNLIGRDGCYFGFGGRGHSGTCTGLS